MHNSFSQAITPQKNPHGLTYMDIQLPPVSLWNYTSNTSGGSEDLLLFVLTMGFINTLDNNMPDSGKCSIFTMGTQ